jgi:hypothetical protein
MEINEIPSILKKTNIKYEANKSKIYDFIFYLNLLLTSYSIINRRTLRIVAKGTIFKNSVSCFIYLGWSKQLPF